MWQAAEERGVADRRRAWGYRREWGYRNEGKHGDEEGDPKPWRAGRRHHWRSRPGVEPSSPPTHTPPQNPLPKTLISPAVCKKRSCLLPKISKFRYGTCGTLKRSTSI